MMSSLSWSLKQSAAFSLSLSDPAGVLAPTTIFQIQLYFLIFFIFWWEFQFWANYFYQSLLDVHLRHLSKSQPPYWSILSICYSLLSRAFVSHFFYSITNSAPIWRVMKSCLHAFSPSIWQAQPLLISDFAIAVAACSSSIDDLLFRCVLSLGFSGLHCLGEITDPNCASLGNP